VIQVLATLEVTSDSTVHSGQRALLLVAVGLWSKFGVGTKIKPTSYDYAPLSNIDE
jgi:hypothetical protein